MKQATQSFSKKDKTGKYPKLKEIAAIFADMDLNNDGHVSYEEICDYIDERAGEAGGVAAGSAAEGKGDDTRTTFAKALKKRFDDLDKSGDGDLSKREVKQALQTLSEKDKSGKYPKLKEIASIFWTWTSTATATSRTRRSATTLTSASTASGAAGTTAAMTTGRRAARPTRAPRSRKL